MRNASIIAAVAHRALGLRGRPGLRTAGYRRPRGVRACRLGPVHRCGDGSRFLAPARRPDAHRAGRRCARRKSRPAHCARALRPGTRPVAGIGTRPVSDRNGRCDRGQSAVQRGPDSGGDPRRTRQRELRRGNLSRVGARLFRPRAPERRSQQRRGRSERGRPGRFTGQCRRGTRAELFPIARTAAAAGGSTEQRRQPARFARTGAGATRCGQRYAAGRLAGREPARKHAGAHTRARERDRGGRAPDCGADRSPARRP